MANTACRCLRRMAAETLDQTNNMKDNHTDITIVLDRSGSMSSVASDTIGGFNRFLDDQKKAPGTATITLNQFDHEYQRVIDAKPIAEAYPLTAETFVPRGNTALLDAIGRSINETGARLSSLPEDQRPAKVVVVIITDGHENASREFDRSKIDSMITEQRDKWNWEFVFLGANQDAIKAAQGMGIAAANAMTYAANAAGTSGAFQATSANLVSLRAGQSRSMGYSGEQRRAQKDAGATH